MPGPRTLNFCACGNFCLTNTSLKAVVTIGLLFFFFKPRQCYTNLCVFGLPEDLHTCIKNMIGKCGTKGACGDCVALGCSIALSELHISCPASAFVNCSRFGFILSAHDTGAGRKNGRGCSWKY